MPDGRTRARHARVLGVDSFQRPGRSAARAVVESKNGKTRPPVATAAGQRVFNGRTKRPAILVEP